jgi:hypothetical protein
MVLLRFNADQTFTILEEKPLFYMCPRDQEVDDTIADARLMWFRRRVYTHGNGWGLRFDDFGAQKKQLSTAVVKCSTSKNCELAVEMLMRLESEPEEKGGPHNVHEIVFPCMNNDFSYKRHGTDVIEKNWSFFEVNGEMYMEYMLGPHIVARIDMDMPRTTCNHPADCSVVHRHDGTVFEHIARAKGGNCFFSPGGSPIRWSKKEFINVGHVKYDYTAVELLAVNDKLDTLRMHPGEAVYLMFFYTFSAQAPFEILRVSHSFIPSYSGNPYALVFAMGIAPLPKRQGFVVSYGEGDSTSNLLTLSRVTINRMLVPVDKITPETYRFEWLPAEINN